MYFGCAESTVSCRRTNYPYGMKPISFTDYFWKTNRYGRLCVLILLASIAYFCVTYFNDESFWGFAFIGPGLCLVIYIGARVAYRRYLKAEARANNRGK